MDCHGLDLNTIPEEQQEHEQQGDNVHHPQTNQVEAEHATNTQGHNHMCRKKLSNEERVQILLWLLHRATEAQLPKGTINSAAQEFNTSRRTVGKIWNTTKQQRETNQRYNVNTKTHKCGRKRLECPTEQIKGLKMGDRSCIRDLASRIAISKTKVHRMIKRGQIRPHTNALHPGLKEDNKLTRLKWILNLLQGDTPESKQHYYPMFDFVHLDEKWFYLTKKSHRVYLAEHEKGKYRAASSSKFIPKVMFTMVVGRPRFNSQGECTFDGKFGIFLFTYKEASKRSSKNRQKGTVVTKLVESVNQKITREMLIHQIIPAIKSKWSADASKVIFIQQDNAKAHISQHNAEWQHVYIQDGFTFILIQQPPNSPDLNILDLGFFRSIQSLMHKKMPKDIDDMINAVNEAFYELQPKTLSNVWMSLQYVMNEILKCKGGNEYDVPHVEKQRLEALGLLEESVKAPSWVVQEAWDQVHMITQVMPTEQARTQANYYDANAEDVGMHETQEYEIWGT